MIWYLKNNTTTLWIGTLILFLISFCVRFIALNQTPYANGWDGYYYVMQTHSFIEYGHLKSLDYSLIYPYFIIVTFFISDYELAFKIGCAILAGALTAVTLKTISGYCKNMNLAILGASITIFSPGITFFLSQFPKNFMGILFLLLVAYYLVRKRYLLAVLFIILSILTHRLTGALGIIFLLISMIRSISWKYLVGTFVAITLVSFLPGILHFTDLERFKGELSITPQFAPLSFINLKISSGIWNVEVILSAVLILLYLIWFIKHILQSRKFEIQAFLPVLMAAFILFPFFKMEHGSMGYRFFLLLPFVTPFIMVFALRQLAQRGVVLISLVLIISSGFSYRAYNPTLHDAPNRLYEQITATIQNHYSSKQYSLVIAHKSLAEIIIYKSEFDALNWSVPAHVNKEHVLRVVHGIPQRILSRYANAEIKYLIVRLNTNYCIVPESTWESILQQAADDKQFMELVYNGNNPFVARPEYLLKGKGI
ncbi:MAG: hypothetical protein AAGA64_16255 [Bacteroidota bacterium]